MTSTELDPTSPFLSSPLRDGMLEPDGAAWSIAEWNDDGGGFDPPLLIAPPHLHHEDDESWYVLEGTLAFRLDGEEFAAPAGSAVTVPRGVVHTWWNPAPAPARYLIVMTPRIRELIETLHAFTSSPEELKAHFRRYRSELVDASASS
jgi:mannose-6-phosphate isomerase-like protein (cupin superfamily)